MKNKIMQLVSLIFHSDRHQHHVASKFRAKKHAFWLRAQEMPPEGGTRYGSDTQGDFFILDLQSFEAWLTFLLGNMYVEFAGDLFIQAIGTPMASNLADFFLAMCELQFVRTLVRVIHSTPVDSEVHIMARRTSQSSAMNRRYIYDLSSINNPYLQHLVYDDTVYYGEIHGVYPRFLLLKKVQVGRAVDYLDITICPSGRGHRLTTVLYDKRKHPPLSSQFIVSYPHASSQISDQAKYGVIISQFHRFWRNIMLRANFLFRMTIVAILYHKGYDMGRMLSQTRRLCFSRAERYGIHSAVLMRSIESKLHAILDDCSDPLYRLIADDEARVRTVLRDLVHK